MISLIYHGTTNDENEQIESRNYKYNIMSYKQTVRKTWKRKLSKAAMLEYKICITQYIKNRTKNRTLQ